MELDVMGNAKVKTAKERMDRQAIEWVSVIEIPVENFVRKNELVLSTAIGCGHDPVLLCEFVSDVYEAGASALGIAKGRYVFEMPQEVLDFAEERNFTLIEIPWEVRFSDITHSVMRKLSDIQDKELRQNQQELLNLILRSSNPSKVAEFVGQKIEQPVLITSKTGMVKGKSKNARTLVEKWNQCVRSKVQPEIISTLKDDHHPLHTRIESFTHLNQNILQIPIQTANSIQGYLVVLLPSEYAVESFLSNQYYISIIEQASTVLAMWFLRENAIEETEMRLRGDFVWSLAKEEIYNWDRILAQAKSLKYDVNKPYVCILGFPENLESLFEKTKSKTTYQEWEKSIIHYIEDEGFHAANAIERKIMITSQNNEIVIFLEVSFDQKNEIVYSFLDLVERRLMNLLPKVMMSWGIGRYHEGLSMFHNSYKDALTALEIGRRKVGQGHRIAYEDTRIDRALLALANSTEIKDIVMATISPLIKYDEQRNMDLIRTFTAYNQNQGKVSQTARYLNLHRQSLLYRLRKIESLTDLSLVNPDDRFLLDLSIKIWTLGLYK